MRNLNLGRDLSWRPLAAALLAPFFVAFAHAEDEGEGEGADDGAGQVEEIIVSATYRDTRLMDTPLAISAVTDQDIVNKGIEDIQTLYQSIPGLSYRSNSQTYNTLTVRGITPPADGGAATVGVYFDNMPITDSAIGGLSQTLGPLFDLERVEVLKGPQGTLYGEGAMGGALRYITKKPDVSGFDWNARTEMEAIGESSGISYRADAMVNIPLSERLAARFVGYTRDRKGIIDQTAPRNEKDVDTFEEIGGRLRVSWYVSDALEISAMVNVVNGDYGGPGLSYHCFNESTPSDPTGQVHVYALPDRPFCTPRQEDWAADYYTRGEFDQFDVDPYITDLGHWDHQSGGYDDAAMYNFAIDWELPFADFISSTSWFDRERDYSEETSPRFSIGLILAANAEFGLQDDGRTKMTGLGGDGLFFSSTERLVQEFRLVSNTDSRWQWTAGAYYKDDDTQTGAHRGCHNGGPPVYDTIDVHCWLQYNFYPDVPIAEQAEIINYLNAIVPGNTNYRTYGEQAVFGEVTYQINDSWEVLVGARYADVSYELLVAQPGLDTQRDPVNELEVTTKVTSPKVTLTWRPRDDWMLYLTYSQGFRPGIVNSDIAAILAQLEGVLADPDEPAQRKSIAQSHLARIGGLQTIDGDEAENYEFGVKATVADGRFSFVGSLYRIDWVDTIISVREDLEEFPTLFPLGFQYNRNSGEARSEGLEFEVETIITDSLRLNFGGDYNWKAEIYATAAGRYLGVGIQPGNRLANAPEYSFNASLIYDFQIMGYDATVRADGYAIDESWNTANNERPAPPYETVDVRLTLKRPSGLLLSAYVRNVTDEVIIYELNQVGYRFGRPRTYGVQIGYRL